MAVTRSRSGEQPDTVTPDKKKRKTNMALSVIVVGAGIGGLAAAIALRKAGHKVTVLEKHPAKREVGFAITVPPNASRILRYLDVDFDKAGMTIWKGLDLIAADQEPLQWEPGPTIDAEKIFGAPHMTSHRVDLHEALWAKAIEKGKGTPVDIQGGVKVEGFSTDGSITLENGDIRSADLIIAADGIRSNAHVPIVGEERPAQNTGTINLRFTVATDALLANPLTSDLMRRGDHRAAAYQTKLNKVGLYRSPCRNNHLQNFGLFYKEGEYGAEVGDRETKPSQAMALDIAKVFSEPVREICKLASDQDMYFWRISDRDPLPSFQSGRLALLGDACHPMQPNFGQGASQSIMDAVVLGIVLEDIKSPEEIPEQLKMYESLRKRVASGTQLLSRSEGITFQLSDDTTKKLRQFVSEEELPKLEMRAVFGWMNGQDCIKEAQQAMRNKNA